MISNADWASRLMNCLRCCILWRVNRVLHGFGGGLGVFYVGDRQGDLTNTYTLPSYVRTDAALYYRHNNFQAALNFKNLFDVLYYEGAFNINRVFRGDPFEVEGSLKWRF